MNRNPQLLRFFVVYDGECNLCLATVDKLRAMTLRADLTYVPLQHLVSGRVPPWPGIADVPPSDLRARLHVTDEAGRRYSGADAILKLMRLSPSLAWLAAIGNLPGFRGLARLAYRVVARYRYRLFGRTSCSDGVCSLPRPAPSDGGQQDAHSHQTH